MNCIETIVQVPGTPSSKVVDAVRSRSRQQVTSSLVGSVITFLRCKQTNIVDILKGVGAVLWRPGQNRPTSFR